MLTHLGQRFETPGALASALQNHIRSYPARLALRDGRWMLRLPGRPDYPWRAPRLRIRLRRHPPGSNLGEVAETATLDFVLDRSEPCAFYDIGASQGYFAHIAAMRRDKPTGIHAFDLSPTDLGAIERTAAGLDLDGITIHQTGLGRTERGMQDIWVSRTRMFDHQPTDAEMREPWPIRAKLALTGKTSKLAPVRHRVHLDSIDAFVERTPPAPGLIKMDIDGYEAEAIPGGMETFRTARPVLMLEIHRSRFYRRFDIGRPDFLRPLFDLGYTALFLENRARHKKVDVIPVKPDDPRLFREQTDFVVFV